MTCVELIEQRRADGSTDDIIGALTQAFDEGALARGDAGREERVRRRPAERTGRGPESGPRRSDKGYFLRNGLARTNRPPAETSRRPSGEKSSDLTGRSCPSRVALRTTGQNHWRRAG